MSSEYSANVWLVSCKCEFHVNVERVFVQMLSQYHARCPNEYLKSNSTTPGSWCEHDLSYFIAFLCLLRLVTAQCDTFGKS